MLLPASPSTVPLERHRAVGFAPRQSSTSRTRIRRGRTFVVRSLSSTWKLHCLQTPLVESPQELKPPARKLRYGRILPPTHEDARRPEIAHRATLSMIRRKRSARMLRGTAFAACRSSPSTSLKKQARLSVRCYVFAFRAGIFAFCGCKLPWRRYSSMPIPFVSRSLRNRNCAPDSPWARG